MKIIEDNVGLIILIIGVLMVIELGIGAFRLPKEFRSRIIPKLEFQLYQYDQLRSRIENRIDLLSEIEEQRSKEAVKLLPESSLCQIPQEHHSQSPHSREK